LRIGNFGAVLLGLIFLAASVFTTAVMVGWAYPVQNLIDSIPKNTLYSSLAAIGLLLLAILSFTMVRFRGAEPVAAVSATKFGQIRIADRTIEEIASRASLNVEGIKEVVPRIQPLPEGIAVQLQTVMNPGFVIPRVMEELQGMVKEDVEKYTGLRVAEVKVMVQSLDAPSTVRLR